MPMRSAVLAALVVILAWPTLAMSFTTWPGRAGSIHSPKADDAVADVRLTDLYLRLSDISDAAKRKGIG